MSSGSTRMPSAAITSAMRALGLDKPVGRPVLQRLRARLGRDPLGDRRERLRRERAGVGQAAGERDHLGSRGHRHQVAHRGGLHDAGARREQSGVSLDVPRRRALGRYRHPAPERTDHTSPPSAPSHTSGRAPASAATAGARPFLPVIVDRGDGPRGRRHRLHRHRLGLDGELDLHRDPRGAVRRLLGDGPRREERADPARRESDGGGARRIRSCCAVAGALLFAASLADGGYTSWPGLVAGALVGLIGYLALGRFFMRANQRLFATGDPGVVLGLAPRRADDRGRPCSSSWSTWSATSCWSACSSCSPLARARGREVRGPARAAVTGSEARLYE